ncbi:MAG: TldD/PmbA family protein [Nitrospirae bacterium]|nr:TldD/PmbA family protein [Nitrospirota bacterium]
MQNRAKSDPHFSLKLIDAAILRGAEEAEVFLKQTESISIEAKGGKAETIESSNTFGYCLRIIKKQRLGFSYSTDAADFEKVAFNAVSASEYTEQDGNLGFPLPSDISSVNIYDEHIEKMDKETAIQHALALEHHAMAEDSRIKKLRKPSVTFTVSSTHIANSKGINESYSATGCYAQLMAIAEESGLSQMGWEYEGSRFLSEISCERVAKKAAQRALQLLGAEKTTSFKGSVLLDNSVACDFLGILSSALSAESVQKKKSLFADKIGMKVLNHNLSIIDSGLIDGKLGSKPFDDEGVAVKLKSPVENGILKSFMHNTYTAKKSGALSTGNAIRGSFRGMPYVGPTNLYLEPISEDYSKPFAELVASVDRGIYVIETMGMHTANPISGEFSIGVSGLLINAGKLGSPVKELVISGNITDLFKNISLVGEDLRFYGNIGSSSLLIENFDISA